MIALQFRNLSDSLRFRLAEWGCAAAMAAWGWILIQPSTAFDNPAFVVMRHWANEETWGWASVIAGGISLFVMVYNGRFRHFPEARMTMAAVRAFLWASIVWGLIRADMLLPGIAPYSALLFMDLRTVYIASHEASLMRRARHNGT